MDQLVALGKTLGHALAAHDNKLTLAESCTGGLVASLMTETPGSSAWFDCGFVTYSNASKMQLLGVAEDTLMQFGAVSEATAKAMALGALQHSQADIAGSITGIAGPDGGSAEKPVGTVCFAWASRSGNCTTTTAQFDGSRQQIRQQAAETLMTALIDRLAAEV